jgi:hypothetical protein
MSKSCKTLQATPRTAEGRHQVLKVELWRTQSGYTQAISRLAYAGPAATLPQNVLRQPPRDPACPRP